MATFTPKTTSGQLPSTEGDLYAAPASTKAYIKSFRLFNGNSTSETVVLYLKESGGTSRRIARYVLAANEWVDETFAGPLEAQDAIRGVTTTATQVDYSICVVEESA
jgi:hypothetical protein